MKVREMIECHLRAGICGGIALGAVVLSLIWYWAVGSSISGVVLAVSVAMLLYYGGQLIGTKSMFKELVEWDLVKLERLDEEIEEDVAPEQNTDE